MSIEDEVDELARTQAEDVFEEKIDTYDDRITELETLLEDQQTTIEGLESAMEDLGKEYKRFRDEVCGAMVVNGHLHING